MKQRLIYIILLFACAMSWMPARASEAGAPAAAPASTNETLAYNIYFHMGFIWSKAGYGKLNYKKETTSNGQTRYHGQLAAKSLSIVEHIMQVRDTLDCWFNAEMVPTHFKKATHEGSYNCIARNTYDPYWHNKDAAHTLQNVDSTFVTINRWKKKSKDEVTTEKRQFSNAGPAYDMLSVFYSIRRLDFAKMVKGKKMKFPCYDGIKSQMINVEFHGREKCELRSGKKYDTYLVYLTFDTKDQKNTPLKVWLSTTDDHRPIKAVIALNRIGAVQCEIIE